MAQHHPTKTPASDILVEREVPVRAVLAQQPVTAPRRLHVARARIALEDIARGSLPADQILDKLFRSHKEMGKRDRAAVSDLVYGVLRDVCRLQALAGDLPAAWLARHLADLGMLPLDITDLGLPMPVADGPVSLAASRNLPAALASALSVALGDADSAALAAAVNQPAPVDVRINTLKGTRDEALATLTAAGIVATATPYSPWGLRLAKRLSRQSPLLLDGLLEPQDEGSQLLALLTAAAPGETVIDWCAGAGGKSLALAAMMENQGRLIACDISASRLAKLSPRATRAGATIIETHLLSSLPALEADAVLVDAPCSGLGTLRRAPELRLRSFDFTALANLQLQILSEAASAVRPGGRLIYGTCSLLADENEAVIAAFLSTHPEFEPATDAPSLAAGLLTPAGSLRLWPHQHGTDGFFAQLLRRSKSSH